GCLVLGARGNGCTSRAKGCTQGKQALAWPVDCPPAIAGQRPRTAGRRLSRPPHALRPSAPGPAGSLGFQPPTGIPRITRSKGVLMSATRRPRMRALALATGLALASLVPFHSPEALARSAKADIAVDIPYEEFTLPNGLRVIVHTDRKAPIVAVNIWYHDGSKNELPGRTGFAHLFEHLMFQGSENYQGEFFEPFELVGATNQNGTTNSDRTNYFQNVPTTALDMALWMESDRMGHFLGSVTQELLDEQRGVVQNEKRQGENQPYGQAYQRLIKASSPEGHPYSWTTIGSMADLDAATLE